MAPDRRRCCRFRPSKKKTQAVAPPSQVVTTACADRFDVCLSAQRASDSESQTTGGDRAAECDRTDSGKYRCRLCTSAASVGKLAMPFLHSDGKRLFLRNHFLPETESTRDFFALSGLYVMPKWESGMFAKISFAVADNASRSTYQHFLVTPASLDWYFPYNYLCTAVSPSFGAI